MTLTRLPFDVVVIGGGHAGCEAFAAACRVGVRAALVTPSRQAVGTQPCNPAVGGPGKGHLVREVVALGGIMGEVTDRSGIQFRTLNRTRGPAVRATRVQTDSAVYVLEMMVRLEQFLDRGTLLEDTATALHWKGDGPSRRITGVQLERSGFIPTRSVVITTGTFLRGMLFIGDEMTPGGRRNTPPSVDLALSLERTGLPLIRLKTGTCPRLSGDSIDVSSLEPQPGDDPPPFFSPDTRSCALPQRTCHLTWTGEHTHAIIRENMHRSAMYSGLISGTGPRYCPSIEAKINRFADKDRHQIFLEPEDRDGRIIYPSGLSTSFPRDVQEAMVHSIPGLERARIVRFGYAVEYDAVQPRCLSPHLEVDGFAGLFLAGQILGTSGYEEAAALGLIAGANAALLARGDAPIVLRRDQAYAGVMIDDLTGTGVDEPYRMFTSRAEYRLLLREDNADERLLAEGLRAGLIDETAARRVRQVTDAVKAAGDRLRETVVTPSSANNATLREAGLDEVKKPSSLLDLARREGCALARLLPLAPWLGELDDRTRTRLEVDIRYEGYLGRQEAQAKRLGEMDTVKFPPQMVFRGISGLRGEVVEKLEQLRPATLGQASRIPGITPAAIEILRVYAKRQSATP